MNSPKILVLDIETAPIEAYVWGLWDQNIGIDFIKCDWTILSFAAQWVGRKEVIYADTGGDGVGMVRNDKAITVQIRGLLDEADIVVAQNGKQFDVRKINARIIEHGLLPPSPYRVIDTMIEAKKYFAFTSQKLAWTSKILTNSPKDEHKKFPGFELWKECLLDNPAAWAEMRKYNIRDIRATLLVYLKLRPWINNHPNMGMYTDKPACPKCGSKNVHARGIAVTQNATYQRFQCQTCGGWARGKTMQTPLAVRRTKLAGV